MKSTFSSFAQFLNEEKVLSPGQSMKRVYVWSDPGVFVKDVMRMLDEGAQPVGRKANDSYAGTGSDWRVQKWTGQTPPKLYMPVHLPGHRISGDHAQRKVRKHLPEMLEAFMRKQKKGRAGTGMMLYWTNRDGGRYIFILTTSDNAVDGRGWNPTGAHEAIVWSWPRGEMARPSSPQPSRRERGYTTR